jgi:uncharacterized membrane protein YcaP (DUF421 family)
LTDLATIILRSIAAFFVLLFVCRLMGKKLISQLTFFDFATGITIGALAAAMSIRVGVPVLHAATGLIVWTVLTILIDMTVLKSLPVRKIIDGESTVIIQNGKLLERNMIRNRYNLDDLMQQLRERNIFDPSQVEFAVLEPNGELSVLPKTQYQTLTAKTLNLSTSYQGMITALVKDGKILDQNLLQNHLTREWLFAELKRRGIDDVTRVFYAALDTSGNLFVDVKREDELNYVQEVED